MLQVSIVMKQRAFLRHAGALGLARTRIKSMIRGEETTVRSGGYGSVSGACTDAWLACGDN